MRLTPLDIREQQFRRVMRGMDPDEVTAFLASVAGEFESMLGENKEMRQRLADFEEKLAEYRNMEKALRDTLLTAERVMTESKESAQREAALLLREAELQAQRATVRISQDVLRLRRELVELRRMKDAYLGRLRWLVRGHLEMFEAHAQEFVEADATLGPPEEAEAGREAAPRDGRPATEGGRAAASPSQETAPAELRRGEARPQS